MNYIYRELNPEQFCKISKWCEENNIYYDIWNVYEFVEDKNIGIIEFGLLREHWNLYYETYPEDFKEKNDEVSTL